jgi:hypothetical protein
MHISIYIWLKRHTNVHGQAVQHRPSHRGKEEANRQKLWNNKQSLHFILALQMSACQNKRRILIHLLDNVWSGMSLPFNFIILPLLFLGVEQPILQIYTKKRSLKFYSYLFLLAYLCRWKCWQQILHYSSMVCTFISITPGIFIQCPKNRGSQFTLD